MIYLIFKIFIYLLLSLGIGFAAGWLTRNIASTKREEALQKTVTEARARVPQFESLMRTRDEQVQRLRDEMSGKDARIAELSGELHGKEEQIRSTQREINTLSSRNQALEPGGDDEETAILMGGEIVDLGGAGSSVDPAEIVALKADVERLNAELVEARAALADAVAEAASAEAQVVSLRAASAPEADVSATDVRELEARVRQQAQDQERLNKALDTEQRKVVELERERELQNKSLQVLHQQLELERERSAAASAVVADNELPRAVPH